MGKLLFSSVEQVEVEVMVQNLELDPDFVNGVKYIIFWHNRGLRVYWDFYAAEFQKSTKKYLF